MLALLCVELVVCSDGRCSGSTMSALSLPAPRRGGEAATFDGAFRISAALASAASAPVSCRRGGPTGMSTYRFFLSYARADHDSFLASFFNELLNEVAHRAGISHNAAGFRIRPASKTVTIGRPLCSMHCNRALSASRCARRTTFRNHIAAKSGRYFAIGAICT
jgi:hypothetical protein